MLGEGTPNNKPNMESVLENIVPQAGNLGKEGNAAIDSDRVKAPVVGAGSTDFGGSQKHDVANQAGTVGMGRLALTLSQKTSEEAEAPNVDHVEKSNKELLGKGSRIIYPKKIWHQEILGVLSPKLRVRRKSPVHGRNTNS